MWRRKYVIPGDRWGKDCLESDPRRYGYRERVGSSLNSEFCLCELDEFLFPGLLRKSTSEFGRSGDGLGVALGRSSPGLADRIARSGPSEVSNPA